MTYSLVDRQHGYAALAAETGNCAAASRRLEEDHGLDISSSTLSNWKRSEDYLAFYERELAGSRKRAAAEYDELQAEAVSAAKATLAKYDASQLRASELPGAALALGKLASGATDKANVLRDRPTQIIGGPKTIDEIDQAFRQRFGPKWDFDSTAEEDPGPPQIEPPK